MSTIYVLSRNMKNNRIFYLKISLFGCKIFNIHVHMYLNRRVFVMKRQKMGCLVILEHTQTPEDTDIFWDNLLFLLYDY